MKRWELTWKTDPNGPLQGRTVDAQGRAEAVRLVFGLPVHVYQLLIVEIKGGADATGGGRASVGVAGRRERTR